MPPDVGPARSLSEMQAAKQKIIDDLRRQHSSARRTNQQAPKGWEISVKRIEVERDDAAKLEADEAALFKRDTDAHASFLANYPDMPLGSVSQVLKRLLSLTDGVDFKAKVSQGKFIDAAFEAKPAEWKQCFRAGKDSCTAARTFATTWLKTLP